MKVKVSILDKNSAFKRLERDIRSMNRSFTKVGFPSGQKVGKATKGGSGHKPARQMSEVAFVAAANEFGIPAEPGSGRQWRVPPRPFFRTALDTSRVALGRFIESQYHRVLGGIVDPRTGLGLIGEWLAAKVKRSINQMTRPPNAPLTIAAKGSSHPLIDTGQMRASVTHVENMRGGFPKSTYRKTVGRLRVFQA